ncbi:MAG: ABC transporter substrate-binding protein, partial [Symploca sp. SIO2C1]|nr:ABC transporter substrate-binding protein [Symploca sp. SIO2C1]
MHDYNSSQSHMSKLAIFRINQGDFKNGGFPVTLQIWENGEISKEFIGWLPEDHNIPQLYQDWQNTYYTWLYWQATDNQAIDNRSPKNSSEPVRKITFPKDEPDPEKELRENCKKAAKALEAHLKKWFEQESSRSLKMDILDQTSEHDSIPIIFQTENEQLRKLPLHLWDLLKHRRKKAGVVLSARHQTCSRDNLENPVKILVILGSSEGINVNRDRNLLNELPRATVTLLEKPEQEELFEHLYDQRWDILFFAGHSFDGEIKVNDHESLSLQKLEYALDEAIQNGLKLAIFNSCDGLKLALHLEKLNIPQVIVMREPVPDLVAQEFLKRFLKFFSEGKSLHVAVRKAREWLQGRENRFPCATWLPIMCQNPAAPELMWPPPPEIPPPEILSPETPVEQLLNLIHHHWWKVAAGVGIVAAAIYIANDISSDSINNIQNPVEPNDINLSQGGKRLITDNTTSEKEEGIIAFAEKQFSDAIEHFINSLRQNPNDPETLIYLNNAIAEQNATTNTGEKLEIAVNVPIGDDSNIAQEILRGVAQAQSQLNCGIEEIKQAVAQVESQPDCNGGIEEKLLQVTITDDQDEADIAEQVANKLAEDPDILGVIGHNSSDATRKAVRVYNNQELVVISPISTSVNLSDSSDYFFRTTTNDATAAKDLANYMLNQFGQVEAAIAYVPRNEYSQSLKKQFQQLLPLGEFAYECEVPIEGSFNALNCVSEAENQGAEVLLLAPGTKDTLDKTLP